MEKKDEIILEHLARYTISIRRVIEETCFGGRSCQNSLNRLLRSGYIKGVDDALDGNFHYYQLTSKGARSINAPVNKAKEKDVKGIGYDLASLWFSCMAAVPRMRLRSSELAKLFGPAPAGLNVAYVAQNDGEESTVFRVFVPGDDTSLKSFLTTLKKSSYDACSSAKYLSWIERGTFRFAILLQNEGRKEELSRLVIGDEFPDIRLHLDIAPSPKTLREFIPPESAS